MRTGNFCVMFSNMAFKVTLGNWAVTVWTQGDVSYTVCLMYCEVPSCYVFLTARTWTWLISIWQHKTIQIYHNAVTDNNAKVTHTAILNTSASVMDWCMSPHGISRPQNKSSPNLGKKYPCKFCGSLIRSVWDIHDRKFVLPKKAKAPNQLKFCRNQLKNVGDIRNHKFVLQKKWAKIHQNCLRPASP